MNAHGHTLSSDPLTNAHSESETRIAVLVDRFGRRFGGAESYCVNVVAAMAMHHEITVIAHEFEHDLPVREGSVSTRVTPVASLSGLALRAKAKQLTQHGYDIIHSHIQAGQPDHVRTIHVTPFRVSAHHGQIDIVERGALHAESAQSRLRAWKLRDSFRRRADISSPCLRQHARRLNPPTHRRLISEVVPPPAMRR